MENIEVDRKRVSEVLNSSRARVELDILKKLKKRYREFDELPESVTTIVEAMAWLRNEILPDYEHQESADWADRYVDGRVLQQSLEKEVEPRGGTAARATEDSA